jgi:hypothetical protein
MRRWIIGTGVALTVLFLGARGYISGHAEGYLREVLDSYNRMQRGELRLVLDSFEGGWSGAEASIRVLIPDGKDGESFRDPLLLDLTVDYGPFFFRELTPGLIRIGSSGTLSGWLNEPAKKRFLERVPEDILYRYRSVMDWWHVLHEKIGLSRIDARDENAREQVRLEPAEIRSDFLLDTLRGRAEFFNRLVVLFNGRSGEKVELENLRLEAAVDEFDAAGAVWGRMRLFAEEIRATLKRPEKRLFRAAAEGRVALRRQGPGLATFTLEGSGEALNAAVLEEWNGVRKARLKLRIESLGSAGVEKFAALQRQRQRLRRELTRATRRGDDAAMQRAILGLQALDASWIDAYNALLIPGKTRIVIDEVLSGEKESRLYADLRYTGERLPKHPLDAAASLMTHLDRLAEGDFEVTMEKRLLARLSPEAASLFDSMVRRGLASLRESVYHLRGRIEKGKIVIEGTRYAPRELLMMILI